MTEFKFFALYENGNKILLLDKIGFENIPREGLLAVQAVINEKTELFEVRFEKDQKPIFAKRGLTGPGIDLTKHKDPVIYLMGWRMKVGDKLIQSITYIMDWAGRGFKIVQAGKFEESHPWFYPINLKETDAFEGERYLDPKTEQWKTK